MGKGAIPLPEKKRTCLAHSRRNEGAYFREGKKKEGIWVSVEKKGRVLLPQKRKCLPFRGRKGKGPSFPEGGRGKEPSRPRKLKIRGGGKPLPRPWRKKVKGGEGPPLQFLNHRGKGKGKREPGPLETDL